jgi:hypothetical protein
LRYADYAQLRSVMFKIFEFLLMADLEVGHFFALTKTPLFHTLLINEIALNVGR